MRADRRRDRDRHHARGGAVSARADPRERFTVLEENDSLYFNSDRRYTQGLRLSYPSEIIKIARLLIARATSTPPAQAAWTSH